MWVKFRAKSWWGAPNDILDEPVALEAVKVYVEDDPNSIGQKPRKALLLTSTTKRVNDPGVQFCRYCLLVHIRFHKPRQRMEIAAGLDVANGRYQGIGIHQFVKSDIV